MEHSTDYAKEVARHTEALSWLRLPSNPGQVLVALDIDGTIVDEKQTITPHLSSSVSRLQEGGVNICIATGRSVPATLPVVRCLGLESAWIASANGSLIGHYTKEAGYTLTNQYTFAAREIVSRVLCTIPTALIGVEDSPEGFRVWKPFPPGELQETIAVQPLEELLAKPVSRVVVRDPAMDNDAFRSLVDTIDFSNVEHAIGWRAWLDINPEGTSKAHGLSAVCENLGVSTEHTLALGDGANDISMLKFAGYGVAMGNARQEVKASANNTTLPVHQDGAAAVLEALARILNL